MLWLCNVCLKLTGQWGARCPHCHAHFALQVCEEPEHDPEPLPLSGEIEAAPRFVTGVDFFDELCGGGLPYGTVTVLAGHPGSCKSTLCLQIACGARTALFASSERPDFEVLRERLRLGLRPKPGQYTLGTDDLRVVERAARRVDADVLILDSWQRFWDPTAPGVPGSASQKRAVGVLARELAESLQIAVVIICQVRKDGRPAVANTLLHDCDAHAEIHITGPTSRLIAFKKSRYCETGELALDITGRGLRVPRKLRAV